MLIKRVYRVGHPRVTETLSKHFMDRGTGHNGTGVYAYASKTRALKDTSDPCEVYEIDTSNVVFFKITNDGIFKNYNSFKRLSRFLNACAFACMYNKDGWYGESRKEVMRGAILKGEEFGFNEKEIIESIERTCMEYKKGSNLNNISQPINILLLSRGYGGVDPGKEYRNDNSIGIVIFRETLSSDAGEEEDVYIC